MANSGKAQNSSAKVMSTMFESVHDSNHHSVVRIYVGLSCELWGFII